MWIAAITRAYTQAEFRVLTFLLNGDVGHAVVEIEAEAHQEILTRVEAEPAISQVDRLSVSDQRAIIQIETTDTRFLRPLTAAGVPLRTPIRVNDGVAYWEITTSQERLSALASHLGKAGVGFQVERVGYSDDSEEWDSPMLTDRQTEVFGAAYEMGYFDIPRGATTADVAHQVGISKSTASDILRRTIRNLVTWFATEQRELEAKRP